MKHLAPNGVNKHWKMLLEAVCFILAKYEPMARYGVPLVVCKYE